MKALMIALWLTLCGVGVLQAQESTLFFQGVTDCDYAQFPFGSFTGNFHAEGEIDTSDFTPEELQGVGGILFPDSTGSETLFWTAVVINPDSTMDAVGMYLTAANGFEVGMNSSDATGLLFFLYHADSLILPEVGDSLDIEEILGAIQAEHKLTGVPTGLDIVERTENSFALDYSGLLIDVDNLSFLVNMSGGTLEMTGVTVGVDENPARRPAGFDLLGIYPNPFNPAAQIRFQLDRREHVTLNVYNLRGRQVLSQELGLLNAGQHQSHLDMSSFSSGRYLLELRDSRSNQTTQITLLK